MTDPQLVEGPRDGLTYRWIAATRPAGLPVFFFHGLGGNEESMWVFNHALPQGGLRVALRAPFAWQDEGYSWLPSLPPEWPRVMDFQPAMQRISRFVADPGISQAIGRQRALLMGFSQGAALAFALAASGALQPCGVVALAGFLPESDHNGLNGLPVFWAHGLRDPFVPIERARQDAQKLREVGARLQYCETDTGHKVGMDCLRGLKRWLVDRVDPSP